MKLEDNELRRAGTMALLFVGIAACVAYVVTRPPAEIDAQALPPPAPTTTVDPLVISEGQAPSVARTVTPLSTVAVTTPLGGGTDGRSPWQAAAPTDFVTGEALDDTLDYTDDIERVGELLSTVPTAWQVEPLDSPELLAVEATQPFAARRIVRADDGVVLAEIWLVASAGGERGDAYLDAARARWDIATAVDQFSPEVGIRLWKLSSDASTDQWVGDLLDNSVVIIHAPAGAAPRDLTEMLEQWRRSAKV